MTQRRQRVFWLATGVILFGAFAGCLQHAENVHHKEPVDLPAPTGTFVHGFEAIQSSKAKASYYVFFLDEWYMGGTILGPHGTRHLQNVIVDLPNCAAIIQIQPSLDPDLNEKRRVVIVTALLKAGITDAVSRVVVAFPMAEGLDGEEAERIYREMLTPPQNSFGLGLGLNNGGGISGGFGGGGGGFSGGFSGFNGGYGGGFSGGQYGGSNIGAFGRPNGYLP